MTLREEFDPSLPSVLGNEGALVQVLVNLIANARDACAQADSPEIAIRTRFVSGFVLNVVRLGMPVKLPIEVQVSDNGPGVDPALADPATKEALRYGTALRRGFDLLPKRPGGTASPSTPCTSPTTRS